MLDQSAPRAAAGGTRDAYRHRRGSATVRVTQADGRPVADADVTIEQVRHEFGFGNIGFDLISLANHDTDERASVFGGASAASAARLAPLYLEL